jgi:hypothetical protein
MKTTAIRILAATAMVFSFAGAASAQTHWDAAHPRRAEVNHRLANQNHRIRHDVRDGDMSHAQAAALHHEDHQIRHEERLMASQNDGHITRQEQRTLNQQENQVSHQISQ